jgi:hypothetical protein
MDTATRPQVGDHVVLVYRECSLGCWCATGEGAEHPMCRPHARLMRPVEPRLGFGAVLLQAEEDAVLDVAARAGGEG